MAPSFFGAEESGRVAERPERRPERGSGAGAGAAGKRKIFCLTKMVLFCIIQKLQISRGESLPFFRIPGICLPGGRADVPYGTGFESSGNEK